MRNRARGSPVPRPEEYIGNATNDDNHDTTNDGNDSGGKKGDDVSAGRNARHAATTRSKRATDAIDSDYELESETETQEDTVHPVIPPEAHLPSAAVRYAAASAQIRRNFVLKQTSASNMLNFDRQQQAEET